MKKALALLLSLIMVFSLASFAAAEDEMITLKVYGKENGGLDWNEQYLTAYIRETLNISLEFTTFTDSQWDTQFTLMLTTGELPDLFVGTQTGDKGEINKLGAQGFLLDFAEYMDCMPNYQALAEAHPMWAAYQQDGEGHIYGLSRLFPSRLGLTTGLTTYVSKTWLKNVGMEMPTTIEEFYAVAKAFKEKDANGNGDPNDEIPIAWNQDNGYRLTWLLAASFGIYNGPSGGNMMADENGKVYASFNTENWKAYLKFMNRLYAEGLLDETCFVQSNEEMREKSASNRVGFISDWTGIFNAMKGADKSLLGEWVPVVGLSSEYNGNSIDFTMGNAGYGGGARTFASAKTEHPEAVAKVVDYFLREEAVIICDYGKEGVTFDYVEDAFGNKLPSYTGYWEGKYETEAAYAKTLKLDEAFKLVRSSAENAVVENASDEMLEQMINDPNYLYTEQAVKEYALRQADRLVSPYPDLLFTADESTERASLLTDIGSYRKAMETAFIIGETDIDAEWDAYLAELEAMGLSRWVEIEQAAYDRMMK